jgi:hypothetical protein
MKRVLVAVGLLVGSIASAYAGPRDFTKETRAVYAVAACGDAAPEGYDKRIVAAHCKELAASVALWKKNWFAKAQPWFAKILDKGYPKTVVYPFGGGDVVTMLAVYPDATDYTSLSLEGMGDPRPLDKLKGAKLTADLAKLRKMLAANLNWAWNTTIQLSIDSSESGAGIPGILTIALVALDAHGYEPLEARYFELGPDGALTYLTDEMVGTWDARPQTPPKRKQTHALQQGLFNNIEIVFRKKGDPSAPKKTFRHIAADLSDKGLAAHGGALAFLAKRSELAAITKAASYLLWKPEFDKIRALLLAKMKVMISDDTGIPPRYAKPAGFTQHTYGTYTGAFFAWARGEVEKEMIELWKNPTDKTMPFRFGYYDNRRTPHVLVTKK